ncbi:hypothetical protein [Brucella sp. IR073]|uniref:hypothetical protein n=1 Tax=unclassified Brucella TaxID=2632610 RepID=UPI003B9877AE
MSEEAEIVTPEAPAPEVNDTAVDTGGVADNTAPETDNSQQADDGKGAPDTGKKPDAEQEFTLPDNWRELWADGDEDLLKEIKRYNSPKGVFKALKEAKATIRSGKLKRDMPDPSDEKAMAEWRKEHGVPEDPTGYKLPETVTKRLTDADKPLLASFTEFAHQKGASQAVIDVASEWYVTMSEQAAEKQIAEDTEAREAAEDALRKELAPGEYKSTVTLAKRFVESVPGVGAAWAEARLPDGRLLGSDPEFVLWAAEMGRDRFGDSVFATPDAESRHNSRKAEIESILKSDPDRYWREGLSKEYGEILEREQKRRS